MVKRPRATAKAAEQLERLPSLGEARLELPSRQGGTRLQGQLIYFAPPRLQRQLINY